MNRNRIDAAGRSSLSPHMRAFSVVAGVLLFLVLTSCSQSPTPEAETDLPGDTHRRAIHETAGFYFLPPMVAGSGPFSGTFDPSQSPVVRVCLLPECTTVIKTFNGGTRNEALTVDLTGESYGALWNTRNNPRGLQNGRDKYRLEVYVGADRLGYADLWFVANARQLGTVTAGYVGVVNGSPLNIKFRIETTMVEGAPDAVDDPGYTTAANTALDSPAPGVLANDDLGTPDAVLTHFGGGSLDGSVSDNTAGNPATNDGHSLTVNADGSFSYTPANDFTGLFTFEYRIENSAGSAVATVTITVSGAATAPEAEDDDFTVQVGEPLAGDLRVDNGHGDDQLGTPTATVVSFGGGSLDVDGAVTDTTTTPPDNTATLAGGTLTVDAAGTFSLIDTTQAGTVTFLYRLENSAGHSDATVTIEITAGPVAPTAVDDGPAENSAPGDAFHTAFNTPLDSASHATPSLLANDDLGSPDAVLTHFGGGSLDGSVSDNIAGNTADHAGHSLTVNADGSFSYTPANDFTGFFTFEYRIANGAASDDAEVTIAVGARPVANGDTYPHTLVGNVSIDTATGTPYSVLGNDAGDALTITLVADSESNGDLTLNPNGTFTFNPASGFRSGNGSFQYTLSNGFGTSAPATVGIPVGAQVIWFINNNAAECTTLEAGCGRLSHAFSTLAALQSINGLGTGNNPQDGHHIFVYESSTAYTGGITLRNNQRLSGQDAVTSLAALTEISLPNHSPALPDMNAVNATTTTFGGAGGGVALASGNHLHGFTASPSTGPGVAGAAVGNLVVRDLTVNTSNGPAVNIGTGTVDAVFATVTSTGGNTNVNLTNLNGTIDLGTGALSGSTGTAFAVSSGGADISFSGTITNTAGKSVAISGRNGGTVSLSGAIGDSGTGIELSNNGGATIDLSGTLTLSTGANAAFSATGGGTLTATGTGNTLATTTGTALRVENTTIGAGGLSFRSISANGGANGIVLNNTGTQAGLTVTGTGTAGSGGTIQNTVGGDGAVAGNGIYLNTTRNVSLSWMNLSNHSNHAIRGFEVTDFNLDRVRITGTNGNNVSEREGSVSFDNLYGSAAITNGLIEGGAEDNVRVHNGFPTAASASLNRLTLDNNDIGYNGTTGNAGVNVAGYGAALMNVTIQNSRFAGSRNNNIAYVINENAAGDVVIQNNTLTNDHPNKLSSAFGIYVAHASNGAVTYQVSGNSVNGAGGSAIEVDRGAGGTGPMSGSITGNTVGTAGMANSGSSAGSGIFVGIVGTGATATHTTTVSSNTVRQFTNFGIYLYSSGTGNNYLNATVQNNDIAVPSSNAVAQGYPTSGFRLVNGTSSGPPAHDGRVCLVLTGNTVSQTGTSTSAEVRVWGRFASRTAIPGLTGDVNTFLANQNTVTVAPGGLGAVVATSTLPFQTTCPPD
jgi:hypothetical protein